MNNPGNPTFGSALLRALMPTHAALAENPGSVLPAPSAMQELQDRVFRFQQAKFPNQPMSGQLKHCQREIDEILKDPQDIIEWADALILLIGAAARNYYTIDDLIDAAHAKLDLCETRKWGEPDAEGVIHHIEEGICQK